MYMPLPVAIRGKINRVLTAGMLLWVAVWSAPISAFGQNIDTWTCANVLADKNWTDAMNWDHKIVPDITSNVVIPSASSTCVVDLTGSSGNAGTLQIMTDGEVMVGDGGSLTVNGNILNDGQLFLNASDTPTASVKLLITGNATLIGSGKLVMSNSLGNSIGGGGSLSNQSTIEGSGAIGGGLTLSNSGTITAHNSHALVLHPNGSGMTNTGTLESTGQGILGLSSGTLMNAGGMIGGNLVRLDSATISGGTLTAGTFETLTVSILDGVTLASGCQYTIGDGKRTTLNGNITNNGQIQLSQISQGAELTVNGTVTLAGTGAITSNGPDNKIDGNGHIINQQTIQGLGTISVAGFNNQGTVTGTSTTAPLSIVSPTVTNTSLMHAIGGGTLYFNGVTVTNTGGTIAADGALIVADGQTVVTGGTMSTSSAGVVRLKSATLDGSANPFTLAGLAQLINDDSAAVTGNIGFGSAANLFIDNTDCKACSQSTMQVIGACTVSPMGPLGPAGTTGTITMSSNANNVIQGATGSEVLTNNVTIQGAGNIGNGLLSLVNGPTGQVLASSSSVPLIIAMGPRNAFTNRGVLSVAANPGSAASVLTVTGPFKNFNRSTGTLTVGSYNISGTFQFDNANILKNAAKLTLAGQIVDQNNANALLNFANNMATGSLTVLPQTFGTNFTSAGPFSNAGKVTITKGVAFVVGGSGTNYNQTGGITTIDGRLAVPLGGLVNITGGSLQGGGALPAGATISGSVSVGNASTTAATFIIGDSTKKSGLIAIANNYTQLATGVMDVQIGGTTPGTQYSQLNITGTAALTGTLNIVLIKPFKPTIGQTFTILNASTGIAGMFSVVNGTAIDSIKHFSVSYTPTTVVLTVVSGPAPQDQNLLAVR